LKINEPEGSTRGPRFERESNDAPRRHSEDIDTSSVDDFKI